LSSLVWPSLHPRRGARNLPGANEFDRNFAWIANDNSARADQPNAWYGPGMKTFAQTAVLAICLGGCVLAPDSFEQAFSDPAKFDFLDCKDLNEREKILAKREQEMRELMDKASQGTGGAVANALAYRTDYLNVRGELKQVRAVVQRKECALDVKRNP
jgi:hypothetical protein